MSDPYAPGGPPPWRPPQQWGPPPPSSPPPGQWGQPTPTWGAPAPQWGPPPSSPARLGGLGWAGIGLGIAVVVAMIAFAVVHVIRNAPAVDASSCQESIPAGASPAATAFLNALNSSYVGWTQISRSLVAEHYHVHLDDLQTEYSIDTQFVATVQQIPFTGAASATAQQYIAVVNDYLTALKAAIFQFTYYDSDHARFVQLDATRSALSHQLRSELGLPSSRCSVLRP